MTSFCEFDTVIGLSSEEVGLKVAGSDEDMVCCAGSVFCSCKKMDQWHHNILPFIYNTHLIVLSYYLLSVWGGGGGGGGAI